MLTLIFVILITAHILHDTAGASTKRGFFDTRIPDLRNKYGSDNVPEECRDQTYCTIKPPNYPEEQYNKMYEAVEILPTPSFVTKPMLETHLADLGVDDCDTSVQYDPIYKVRRKREDDWMNVVQAPKVDYIQRVRLEICNKPSAPCFNEFPPIPDRQVFCQQKYSKWEVLVANGTETFKVKVDLPTCCSCVYKIDPIFPKK